MSKRTRALLPIIALAAVLLAACAPAAQPGGLSREDATAGPVTGYPGVAPEPAGRGTTSTGAEPPGSAKQPPAIPVAQAFDAERALILTANVSMRSKDPWTVSDRVQAIALGLGGDILSLAQSGSGEQRSAALTVRVPQARFNDALRQIRDIGNVEVTSSNVEGKDVTDQFVDLQARLKAKEAEEQRYVALFARANTIEEILKIDQALAQVRTQIEQLTAQLNSIKARTTYSTITVQILPLGPEPVPTPDPRAYDPSKTLERAIAALASLLRVALDAAIWALVFGWIPLVIFGLALLVSRTRVRVVPTA